MDGKPGRIWLPAVALSLIIAAVYLFMITRSTLWDRDEPRFARASVEMIQTGNYLVPTFNGKLWADKPVLVYWLMSLSIRLFGANEFACRFWSAIGTAVSCLITFAIGKKIMGEKQGLLAMIILASSAMILTVGAIATADGVTLPFILGAMAVFIWGLTNGFRFYHVILIGILTGFGMLAKGPIGVLPFPVMIMALWLIRKDYKEFFKNSFMIFVSFCIGISIFLCWAIPANKETQGQFLATFLGRHVITRFLRPMEHHGGNLLLYLPCYILVIIGGFFPWTIFLPGAFYAAFSERLCERKLRITLLTWIISIVIIMTFAATKLPHYIIFIWPALALLAAGVIVDFQKNALAETDKKWLRRGNWFFVPVGLTAGLALIAAPFIMIKSGLFLSQVTDLFVSAGPGGIILNLFVPASLGGIILLFMTFLSAFYLIKVRVAAVCRIMLIGMILFQILYLARILPVIESSKVTPALAKEINDFVPDSVPVATYKFKEPSLNFYLGRNIKQLADQNDTIEWLRQENTAVLVIPEDEYIKIERALSDFPAILLSGKDGLNYSKGRKITLIALLNHQIKNEK